MMKCEKKTMRLYAVTDRAWTGEQSLYEQVEAALKGGVTCVQLREKNLDEDAFLAEAKAIAGLCKKYDIPFIVNDHVEIAIASHADGIHVGQSDMAVADVRRKVGECMMIGVSAHNVKEAVEAEKNGADYLGVGAMFSTDTKKDVSVTAPSTLRDICNAVHIPVVAIGGISKNNMIQLAGTGVDGVAMVHAIFAADDIEEECRQLRVLAEKLQTKKENNQ